MLGGRGCHGGRRQRGDRDGQAEGKDHDGGEDLGPVAAGAGRPHEEGEPGADDERAHGHLQAGTDAGRQGTGPGRQRQHHEGEWEQRETRLERGVALHDLQLDGKQEEGAAQCAVDGEGDTVGPAELAGAEQREREHGVGPVALDDEEGRRGQCGQHEGGHHRRARPAARRRFDEPVGQAGQEHDCERGPDGVDTTIRGGITRFGHVTCRHHQDGGGHRKVDEEDQPPRSDGQEISPDEGAGGRGDPAEPRPGADGAGSIVRAE